MPHDMSGNVLQQLSVEEAEVLMATKKLVVADVRDCDSYEEAHISDAIHLSVPQLQTFIDAHDKNTPILVYCYHGISSQSVARHLIDAHFSEVYSLVGGFEAWKAYHSSQTDS